MLNSISCHLPAQNVGAFPYERAENVLPWKRHAPPGYVPMRLTDTFFPALPSTLIDLFTGKTSNAGGTVARHGDGRRKK